MTYNVFSETLNPTQFTSLHFRGNALQNITNTSVDYFYSVFWNFPNKGRIHFAQPLSVDVTVGSQQDWRNQAATGWNLAKQ